MYALLTAHFPRFNALFLQPLGYQVQLSVMPSNTQFVRISIWALRGFPDTAAESMGRGFEEEVRE